MNGSPDNPCEHGVNEGRVKVKLRLRRPENEMDLFPFDQILDNMLHELCHFDHEDHDVNFYNLLDQLRKEWKELAAKGIPGAWGHLGGVSQQPHLASLLPSEPRRLGGNKTIMKALCPREAARMAAERRTLGVRNWCGGYVPGDTAKDGKGSSGKSHDLARPVSSVSSIHVSDSSVHAPDSSVQFPDSSVHVSDLTSPKRSHEWKCSSVKFLDGSKLQNYLFPLKILVGVVMFELVWESFKYLFC
ncbi:hypothetical protein TIFTF001_031383 [Ficus carica]|uniref:WLM domain-containing protein n=1 Tax=Ficus carica TaxID=3494 RepID=A0AA88J531_FICCA|nr:hypothetical protein TIFTF001_031383 [Ficus carica]